jgi:transposase
MKTSDYNMFVGIDQSKLTFDAAVIASENPQAVHHRQFENNPSGFDSLMKWLKEFQSLSLDRILFCAEHTGLYSLALSVYLHEQQAHFWLETPLQIKLSQGMKRGKNDKADAMEIARYAMVHQHQARLYVLPAKTILALGQLLSFRERLVRYQKSLKTASGELAEFDADITGLVCKESKSLIRTIDKKIEAVDHKMMEVVEQDEQLKKQFDLVTSVHGVGKQTALFVLVYTHCFTSFSDWRKFACYCGIAPFEYSSGTSIRGKTRVSHLGNRKLKSLLTMCALNTLKKENEFKIYYDRRIAQGKSAMSTLNIIRNKIVSRIFAAVKRGTPYVPQLKTAA